MRPAWLAMTIVLGCAPVSSLGAADAEEFARDLGEHAAIATACKASFAQEIPACLDDVLVKYGFSEADQVRLRKAYSAGADEGRKKVEEGLGSGCGDILREIKTASFWAQCPSRKP